MTQPNFRALCAELVTVFKDESTYTQRVEALDRARAALAQHKEIRRDRDETGPYVIIEDSAALAIPPPEPTGEEIAVAIQKGADQEFYATVEALAEYCGCGVELMSGDAREVLYELRRPHIVLDWWGNEKPFC